MESSVKPSGKLSVFKIPLIERPVVRSLDDAIKWGTPFGEGKTPKFFGRQAALRKARWQARNFATFRAGLVDQAKHDAGKLPFIGHLWLTHVHLDGDIEDLGLVSCRLVTDTGVQYIVDAFQNLVELENMRFHALGTGAGAETAAQTALVTELTTQYSTSNTRPTGTLGEKSGDAKTYETTATITVSASVTALEHAVMSQAATGGGVMLDRSLFGASVGLASGESLAATYQLTVPSGG